MGDELFLFQEPPSAASNIMMLSLGKLLEKMEQPPQPGEQNPGWVSQDTLGCEVPSSQATGHPLFSSLLDEGTSIQLLSTSRG